MVAQFRLPGWIALAIMRARCPLRVDAVEKLSDTQRAGNNRIQFLHFFESMLRASLVS
jgi:hypothetical protein